MKFLTLNKISNSHMKMDSDADQLELLKEQEKILSNLKLKLENQKQRLVIEESDLLNLIE